MNTLVQSVSRWLCGVLADKSQSGAELIKPVRKYAKQTHGLKVESLEERLLMSNDIGATLTRGPVVADDVAVTDKSQPVSIAVLANDYASGGRFDLPTLTIVAGPSNGTATIETANCTAEIATGMICSGRISYQPEGGFVGTDAFTYQISDMNGASATGTVTVAVQEAVPAQAPGLFSGSVNYKIGTYPYLTQAVAIGDFTGDRKPDLVTMSMNQGGSDHFGVFRGRGDGTFEDPIFSGIPDSFPTAMAAGDYNGDGKLDLVVGFIPELTSSTAFSVTLLLGRGDGTFEYTATNYPAAENPFTAVAADVNADGKLDAVVLSAGTDLFRNDVKVSVLLGSGNGTFRPTKTLSTGEHLHSVVVDDFNRDGKPDLAASVDARQVVCSDGDDGVITCSGGGGETGGVNVWLGNGDGTFGEAVRYSLAHGLWASAYYGNNDSLALGDFNGDGNTDLAASTVFSDGASGELIGHYTVNVLYSNGDGTFQPAVDYVDFPTRSDRIDADSSPLAAADFDGDGKSDLVTGSLLSHNVSVMISQADGAAPVARNHGIGTGSYALATGDLNGDGRPDIVSANENDTVTVMLANADGRFSRSAKFEHGLGKYDGLAPIYPTQVVRGDFNDDSKPDVVVAGSNILTTILNNGDGTFQSPVRNVLPTTVGIIAVGDFNGDRIPDLADAYAGTIYILIGNGDGTFSALVSYNAGDEGPNQILTADFNHDGKLDLATTSYNNGEVRIRLGNGDGTFRSPSSFGVGTFPLDLTSGDFNNDGNLDLVTAELGGAFGTGGVTVLFGNGNGTFRSKSLGMSCVGSFSSRHQAVATGDFNGDGLPDLVTDEFFDGYGVGVRLNDGRGGFSGPVCFRAEPAIDLQAADFNGDAATDLLVVSGGVGTGIVLGNGDGTLQRSVFYATDPFAQSVAVADFSGDGKPDLIMASGSYYLDFLVNSASGNFAPGEPHPGLPPIAVGLVADTGASPVDRITRDGHVVVESHGAAVRVTVDGSVVTPDSNGIIAVTGDGLHNVTVTSLDSTRNPATATLDFVLDTIAPAVALGLISDTGVSATDRVTSDGRVSVSADDGTLSVLLDGVAVTPDALGNVTAVVDGSHRIEATTTDAAGNTAARTLDFVLDSLATRVEAIQLVRTKRGVTEAVVTFNKRLDAATVTRLENYRVTLPGRPKAIKISSITFDGDRTVTIRLRKPARTTGNLDVAFVDFTLGDLAGNRAD